MLRVSIGYDLHRLGVGRDLILGGVKLPGVWGAIAHSDGDALIHAIIDALLSPLGEDIGGLFPDSDPRYAGANSLELLRIVKEIKLSGVTIGNIDCVVILDRPKIAPYISAMKENIAKALDIPASSVGIKGKTSENTRLQSVEVTAVAMLEINS